MIKMMITVATGLLWIYIMFIIIFCISIAFFPKRFFRLLEENKVVKVAVVVLHVLAIISALLLWKLN